MQLYFGLILLLCWVVFVGYWIYSAPKVKRTVSGVSFGAGAAWRIGFMLVVIAIAKFQPQLLQRTFIVFNPWWGALGCVLSVVGISIATWARYQLGRNWGMPMSVKENAELVTNGPYKWVRNPIYSGLILMLIGSGLVVDSWWLFICLTASLYFLVSVFREEKIMLKEFPNTYPAYKARTWRLLPFIF